MTTPEVLHRTAESEADLQASFELRNRMFPPMQPDEVSPDERDFYPTTQHFVSVLDDEVIGTSRAIFPYTAAMPAIIESVAVDARHQGQGIGTAHMQFVAANLHNPYEGAFQPETAMLACRMDKVDFYQRVGFSCFGEPLPDNDDQLITRMTYAIPATVTREAVLQ